MLLRLYPDPNALNDASNLPEMPKQRSEPVGA
jgi:hypothetical protein